MAYIKKSFIGIFICLLSFLLMSHNVSAIEAGSFYPDTSIGGFKAALANNFDGTQNCNENQSAPAYKQRIYTNWDIGGFTLDRDYLLAITFFNSQNSNSYDGKIPVQWHTNYENWVWVKEVSVENVSPSQAVVYMILHRTEDPGGSGYKLQVFSEDYIIMYFGECVSNYGWTTRIDWLGVKNYTTQLNAINQQIQSIRDAMPSQQQITNLNNSVSNLNNTVQNRYDEEDQAMSDAQSDASADGADSQSDVSNATSSLLGVGSQVVSTITNTPATNCNIPMIFAHYSLGTVNVCSNVPTAVLDIVRGVSALVFVPIIVNYAIYLVNKMIYLFRSFQQ